jgi:hypothetical protein
VIGTLPNPERWWHAIRKAGAIATIGAAAIVAGASVAGKHEWFNGGNTPVTTSTTPPPPLGTGNIFVAANGNDAGSRCVRNTTVITNPDPGGTTVCRTWNRAYVLAQKGDTVSVADGTYSGTLVNGGAGKALTGAQCSVWSGDVSGCVNFISAGNGDVWNGMQNNNMDMVHIKGAHVCGVPVSSNLCNFYFGLNDGSNRLLTGIWMENITTSVFFFTNCDTCAITNSDIGPCDASSATTDQTCDSKYQSGFQSPIVPGQSHNAVEDHNLFHDIFRSNVRQHVECESVYSANGMRITNNIFTNCGIIDLFMVAFSGFPNTNATIENNVFDCPGSHSPTSPSNQTSDALLFSAQGNDITGTIVRNNSFIGCARPRGQENPTGNGDLVQVQFIGNIFQANINSCSGIVEAGVTFTFSFNVFSTLGAACGTNTVRGNANYVAPGANPVDAHITAGSVAIGAGNPADCPAKDLTGTTRTGTCTAGAYQLGSP